MKTNEECRMKKVEVKRFTVADTYKEDEKIRLLQSLSPELVYSHEDGSAKRATKTCRITPVVYREEDNEDEALGKSSQSDSCKAPAGLSVSQFISDVRTQNATVSRKRPPKKATSSISETPMDGSESSKVKLVSGDLCNSSVISL